MKSGILLTVVGALLIAIGVFSDLSNAVINSKDTACISVEEKQNE